APKKTAAPRKAALTPAAKQPAAAATVAEDEDEVIEVTSADLWPEEEAKTEGPAARPTAVKTSGAATATTAATAEAPADKATAAEAEVIDATAADLWRDEDAKSEAPAAPPAAVYTPSAATATTPATASCPSCGLAASMAERLPDGRLRCRGCTAYF